MDFFTHKELMCKDTHTVKLADGFKDKLNYLRAQFNRPMVVNSCCRSKSHNEAIGGHPRSLHVYDAPYHPTGGCMAIDISIKGWSIEEWASFIDLAVRNGWSVGLNKSFIHIDRRVDINIKQAWFTY